jgi:predicted DNA-binding protein
MYNVYIMKRTQIYLDEEQAEELARRAAIRGSTASKMIREAIDEYLAEPADAAERLTRYRAALDASFGIAPHLPDGATYVEELRRADRARRDELEQQAE